ncbi:MAG: hypothetical protein AVDCRST_MAG69-2828 [uncultured Solirubrobacteraceae bacterium]|uniref:Uncharacterized protein n=1 Tax=uncultured Solirubrobacteraceae bacterium TaxID=1162706 RepID=A0A6J4T9Z9_9ACTN|nr:MAG: hypothetical protein AVDCRST_MAG69-2828 [uncultured Solirubrobacteraceae bacterium]
MREDFPRLSPNGPGDSPFRVLVDDGHPIRPALPSSSSVWRA